MTNINAFPGFAELELDDDIVLDGGSSAHTGVKIARLGEEDLECEIFYPARSVDSASDVYPDDPTCILIYPLDGKDKPFVGPLRGDIDFDKDLLEAVAIALQDRAAGVFQD